MSSDAHAGGRSSKPLPPSAPRRAHLLRRRRGRRRVHALRHVDDLLARRGELRGIARNRSIHLCRALCKLRLEARHRILVRLDEAGVGRRGDGRRGRELRRGGLLLAQGHGAEGANLRIMLCGDACGGAGGLLPRLLQRPRARLALRAEQRLQVRDGRVGLRGLDDEGAARLGLGVRDGLGARGLCSLERLAEVRLDGVAPRRLVCRRALRLSTQARLLC